MDSFAHLHESLLLASDEQAESYRLVASELSDYRLTWANRCAPRTRVHRLASSRLRLYGMAYGDEVLIEPQLYPDFCLVHYAHQHSIELEVDGQPLTLAPGEALFCNPQRHVHLRWSSQCEQVILRIPTQMLLEAREAHPPAQTPSALDTRACGLPPYVRISCAAAPLWVTQLQAFCVYAQYAQHDAGLGTWLGQVESAMACYLMEGIVRPAQPDSTITLPAPSQPSGANRLTRQHMQQRLDRLEHYIQTHLDTPMTLESLAQLVAVSPRQLSAWTQQAFDLSPMAWLRKQRLHAMRQALLSQPEADITHLALSYGFTHMGRLAAYYKNEFAELPSQTKRRCA